MSRASILSAVKTILEGVTNIGNVYSTIRWVIEDDKFFKEFETLISNQQQVRVWMITRVGGEDVYGPQRNFGGTGIDIPTRTRGRRYDFQIEGFSSFTDDDTESEWQTLIDNVLDEFKNNTSLTNTALIRSSLSYIIDHVWFGKYLVHHVVIRFYAAERDGITPS